MFARHGHYITDTGMTYCHDEAEFDVRVPGDTVTRGPEPVDFCSACLIVEPEWIELTEQEFDSSYN